MEGGGAPTSLVQLGFDHIGLDDGWQACGQGVNKSFHERPAPDQYRDFQI